MSLKRRNFIAWTLILLAAVCWTLGQQMLSDVLKNAVTETTYSSAYDYTMEATVYPSSISSTVPDSSNTSPSEPGIASTEVNNRGNKFPGFLLCIAAAVSAAAAIFVFWQKAPILGPDGMCIIGAFIILLFYAFLDMEYIMWTSTYNFWMTTARILSGFTFLHILRELWGWILAKFSLSWCLVYRISKRSRLPQFTLLLFVGWIVLTLAGFVFTLFRYRYYSLHWVSCAGFVIAAVLGCICLWMYGADLSHFQKQLDNYQQGSPITVGDGAFSQTEAQLLEVQAQHEEAVRTAVTSERFKVELISNVSHDLRTPLTAILGYSELLQKEALSPEGQEQLRCLHLKAGYMNDLVESLFELTKVSSGVIEAKKEQIDLVRLLEQTIGLFDDQLVSAGLSVRRNYPSDALPVITDGARMHQVFANLLGNAIKYALAGTRIYLEVKEAENCFLIRMMNTSSYEMDFKPEEIMQRFARGDKARSTKGSGLGLAIAQTYTESVGGTFRVSVDGDQFSAIVELPKN